MGILELSGKGEVIVVIGVLDSFMSYVFVGVEMFVDGGVIELMVVFMDVFFCVFIESNVGMALVFCVFICFDGI